METGTKIFLWILICVVIGVVLVLGFLGYIPGLSQALGANKPKDLGITYTSADKTAARAKSHVVYEELSTNTPVSSSIVRSGTRPINTSWSSQEITALMNDRPWKYWPIKDVQLKINNDGSAELSGIVIKEKLSGYAQAIGVSQNVSETIINFLPNDPAFYVKANTSLTDNQVSNFDIQSVSLGKFPIPVNILLSNTPASHIDRALAQDIVGELSKYSGKKAAVVNFINNRLSQITGFYAKKAYFKDGKLNFLGNLSEKEATVR